MLDPSRERLLTRYQHLLEISQDLTSTLELDVLLRHIVRAAADLSDAENASILLYDEVKQELYFEATTNQDQPIIQGMSVPVEGSFAGWIVTNCKPLILPDVSSDYGNFNRITKTHHSKVCSLLGVPLINKGKVIGALESVNKRSGYFDEEDQQILANLGAQAALAIENARLFQQSDLIAELVHELRTPLASLNTATHLLLRPELPTEQRSQIAEMIQGEIFRLSDLATSFLDFSRLESGRAQFHITSFNPATLIEESIEVMRARVSEAGLTLKLDLQGKFSPIEADETKIKQVMINLISNAIKYNRPSGSITVTAHDEQEALVITVCDDGHGIPEESLSTLFQRFYRVPGTEKIAAGTGLGLSICKRIVEAHQGSINVSSGDGQGTIFTIRLPKNPTL